MAFFSAIEPMLKASPVTVLLARDEDGKITASFIPKPEGRGGGEELRQPFSLTATASELDQYCDVGIAQLAGAYASLSEQVSAAKAVMEAAGQAKTDEATKAVHGKKPPRPTVRVATAQSPADDDDGDDAEATDAGVRGGSEVDAPTPSGAPVVSDNPFGGLGL